MAAGLPVIAVNSGGPLETVYDPLEAIVEVGEVELSAEEKNKLATGLLLPPSPELWSSGLISLLQQPPSRLKEMGQAGRLRAATKFSLEKLAEELESACRDAVGIRKGIWEETGSSKMVAFLVLATFCAITAVTIFFLVEPLPNGVNFV